jgi:hypothetical protein
MEGGCGAAEAVPFQINSGALLATAEAVPLRPNLKDGT